LISGRLRLHSLKLEPVHAKTVTTGLLSVITSHDFVPKIPGLQGDDEYTVRTALKERIMAPDLLLMRFQPLFGTLLMEIKVNFLDKLRLEAKFDDFTVIADQPIR
jgi:hypothetical protein